VFRPQRESPCFEGRTIAGAADWLPFGSYALRRSPRLWIKPMTAFINHREIPVTVAATNRIAPNSASPAAGAYWRYSTVIPEADPDLKDILEPSPIQRRFHMLKRRRLRTTESSVLPRTLILLLAWSPTPHPQPLSGNRVYRPAIAVCALVASLEPWFQPNQPQVSKPSFSLLLCVCSASAVVAQTPFEAAGQLSQEVSVPCTVAVEGFRYPPAAVSARIMGVVSATVDFDNHGAIGSIAVKGHPLLASDVVKTLRSASPIERCAGQKIAMRFSFVLDNNLEPKTPVSVRSVSAFDYQIVAPAPVIGVSISDPAWIFSRRGRFFHHAKMALLKLEFW
jgi:hypothetical protein